MIEVTATYDFVPGVDAKAFEEFVRKSAASLVKATGFVELRGNRNLAGSPYARATYVFQTFADWARYVETPECQALLAEARRFITDIRVDAWGPSPVLPSPVHPGK